MGWRSVSNVENEKQQARKWEICDVAVAAIYREWECELRRIRKRESEFGNGGVGERVRRMGSGVRRDVGEGYREWVNEVRLRVLVRKR